VATRGCALKARTSALLRNAGRYPTLGKRVEERRCRADPRLIQSQDRQRWHWAIDRRPARGMDIMVDKVPMTIQGHAALEAELKMRQAEERPRIILAIQEARAHGDLSENAEYHAAKEAQGLNEGRIAELEDKLGRAEVIDVSKLSGNTVKFGATVTLIDDDTEQKRVYQLVGEMEADVKAGKLSITSPIARAIIGKKVGDYVEVVTPGGGKSYEIAGLAFR
jgi:transcription elongation factor GreA